MSTHSRLPKTTDRNVIVIIKPDGQRYHFTYDNQPASSVELLRTLGRYASDSQLSFTWQDAVAVSWKMKQLAQGE